MKHDEKDHRPLGVFQILVHPMEGMALNFPGETGNFVAPRRGSVAPSGQPHRTQAVWKSPNPTLTKHQGPPGFYSMNSWKNEQKPQHTAAKNIPHVPSEGTRPRGMRMP